MQIAVEKRHLAAVVERVCVCVCVFGHAILTSSKEKKRQTAKKILSKIPK